MNSRRVSWRRVCRLTLCSTCQLWMDCWIWLWASNSSGLECRLWLNIDYSGKATLSVEGLVRPPHLWRSLQRQRTGAKLWGKHTIQTVEPSFTVLSLSFGNNRNLLLVRMRIWIETSHFQWGLMVVDWVGFDTVSDGQSARFIPWRHRIHRCLENPSE